MGRWEGDRKALGCRDFSVFLVWFLFPFFGKTVWKFLLIFFSSEQVLVVCTYHPSFWGGGAVGEVGRRMQVPGQPGQVREPLSQDKDMENKNQVLLHGRELARHMWDPALSPKDEQKIWMYFEIIIVIFGTETWAQVLVPFQQTLFQWATSLSPECLNISIYLLNGNASLYSFFSVSVVRIFPPMIFSPFHPPAFVVYFNFQSSRYCRKVAVRGLSWPWCGRSCLQYKYLGSWSERHTESLRTVWATVIHSQPFPPPQRNKNKK